jgi:hypothetical protein
MKYHGVKINRIEYNGACCAKGKKGFERDEILIGYAPVGMSYPMTLKDCQECIDRLIINVMTNCNLSEKEAIKIINNT